MNLGAFDRYYTKAQAAKAGDNLREAKRWYLLAARSLLEAALSCDNEYRHALMERANHIQAYADSLSQDESLPIAKPGSAAPRDDDSPAKFAPVEIPAIGFGDVAGLDTVKESIRRRIIFPAQHPEVYATFNKKAGGGVLMYGLPGTGKTLIAKAIAHEAEAKFFSVRSSDIVSKWFGEAESNVKALFDAARREKCAVIFFDEFESLAAKRNGESSVMPRLVAEFLSQIQGFSASENTLLLLAATNRPWDIDSAFLRSGRFDELIYIPLPDLEARKQIIMHKFSSIPVEEGIDFDYLAIATEGFNGADMAEFCDRCVDFVIDRCVRNGGQTEGQLVTKNDIDGTLRGFSSSVRSEDIARLDEFKKQYGTE